MAKKEKEKAVLKKGVSQFMLIGRAKVSQYTYNINKESEKSDWIYNTLNLGVDCGQGNVVYADMMGGYGAERDNVIYVHGKKVSDKDCKKIIDDYENRFTIAWEDRTDKDILKTIGEQCFITVGLEKDKTGKVVTEKFLSPYDAIDYISANLEDGTVINVKGNLQYQIYNDNISVKKNITSIFLSKVEDETKFKASFTQTILLDSKSIHKKDKETGVFPVTACVIDYVKMYNNKEVKTNIPYNVAFEIEEDKIKPENTKKFIEKVMKVKNDITELTVEGEIIEGQALTEITDADIPEDIQELIDMGAITREEVAGKMAVNNNIRTRRWVIKRPLIKMVGDDDNKRPVVQKVEKAYTEDDLILDFMYETVDDPYDEENIVDNDVDADNDEDDWLNQLED